MKAHACLHAMPPLAPAPSLQDEMERTQLRDQNRALLMEKKMLEEEGQAELLRLQVGSGSGAGRLQKGSREGRQTDFTARGCSGDPDGCHVVRGREARVSSRATATACACA